VLDYLLYDRVFFGTLLPGQPLYGFRDEAGESVLDVVGNLTGGITVDNGTLYTLDEVMLPYPRDLPGFERPMIIDRITVPRPPERARLSLLATLEANAERRDLSTYLNIVQAADPQISEQLASGGPFTILAPTDEAFERDFSEVGVDLAAMLENPDHASVYARYQVLPGYYTRDDFETFTEGGAYRSLLTLFGSTTFIINDGQRLYVHREGVTFAGGSIPAANGIIHLIDGVMFPG
jgi:uncharacterized surface protein with fasciclin (FAS1) repeats